jgi:hypothetical protein
MVEILSDPKLIRASGYRILIALLVATASTVGAVEFGLYDHEVRTMY